MANVYVRSAATGTATGADWTNAYTTLAAALAAKVAGDSFWVSEDHAETQASAMTLSNPGTAADPCFVHCTDHAGTVPPVSADLRTSATVSTTGANAINMNGGGLYVYGITFNAGSAANNASLNIVSAAGQSTFEFVSCACVLNNTAPGARFNLGISTQTGIRIRFTNTTFQFGSTSQTISCAGTIIFRNTPNAIAGAIFPGALIGAAQRAANVSFEGCDLSALDSGKSLVSGFSVPGMVSFKDCKINASVTVATTPVSLGEADVIMTRCDSSATSYRTEKYSYAGTQTVETTIVRTGGASDGTTSIAWKLVTTANSRWILPFEALPITIWNASTSSITVTVYGIWGGGAVPNNDDIWIEVEYLGSAATPMGSFATSTKANNLAANAALASDSSTWGGSTTKFKMIATFTPAQAGAVYIYIKAAKASTTFYIDPEVTVS